MNSDRARRRRDAAAVTALVAFVLMLAGFALMFVLVAEGKNQTTFSALALRGSALGVGLAAFVLYTRTYLRDRPSLESPPGAPASRNSRRQLIWFCVPLALILRTSDSAWAAISTAAIGGFMAGMAAHFAALLLWPTSRRVAVHRAITRRQTSIGKG